MKFRTFCLILAVLSIHGQTRVDSQKQLMSFAPILKVERAICSGSGFSLDAQGNKIPYLDPATGQQKKDAQGNLLWMQYDCAGIQYFKFTLADGSTRTYLATPTTGLPSGSVTWVDTPIKPSEPK